MRRTERFMLSVAKTEQARILVIIPAYNEASNIVDVVDGVKRAGYDYIVVNDGSTDNTLRVCIDNGFNVLNLKENLGIGGAVQAGHKYAQKHGYDIDVQLDGDGQHDANYIPRLLEGISAGNDLVVGSRYLEKTEGFQSSFMRRVGIRWLSLLIGAVTGRGVTDPTSGFRACGKKAIDLFCRNYPIDYPEPESIVAAIRHGLVVSETSVVMKERVSGKSSIRALSSVYYMLKVTLAILIVGVSRGKRGA